MFCIHRPARTHTGSSAAHARQSPLPSATVPAATSIYDLRDLRLYTGRDLRSLLAEEARIWRAQLLWDYAKSIELLLGYLDSRILPGFLAVHRPTGRICGYTFAVYETQKAVIGDLFSTAEGGEAERLLLEESLLHHLLPMLQHTPGVDRVESQLLLSSSALQPIFRESGFRAYPRLFMQAALPDRRELLAPGALVRSQDLRSQDLRSQDLRRQDAPPPDLPSNLKLRRWTAPMYQPAADLIHRAYAHHGDTEINDQYRTVSGCLRFLHNIVRFPGCGDFSPEHSFVLLDERSGDLEGVILTTRVEPETAHIPQLCISPRSRTRGLGQLLLRQAATELSRSGMRTLTLTVTEANAEALRLYRRLGFQTRHTFQANVWTR